MLKTLLDQEKLADNTRLTLRVSYFSSLFALVFGLLCLGWLHISEVVPYAFFGFGLANLANTWLYSYHRNLYLTYNLISILGLASSLVITLFTGGINSPFIFVMAIVVFP